MPDRILTLINRWGKSSLSQQYGIKLEFLDKNRVKFNWDNDNLEEDKGLVESNTLHAPRYSSGNPRSGNGI